MIQKPRKQSMRQVKDEAADAALKQSPTYARAVAAVNAKAGEPLKPVEGTNQVRFFRGARVRVK